MATKNAPFKLGQTYYGATATIDVSGSYANVGGKHLEGMVVEFDDLDPTTPGLLRSAYKVKAILVRNKSGVTLLPGRCVAWSERLKSVNGYARTTAAEIAGVVDPYLSSSGVRDGDLFFIIVRGPVLIKTAGTGAEMAIDIVAGAVLYCVTQTTAHATTSHTINAAGRLIPWGGTHTTNANTDGTQTLICVNHFARAISACTTHNTNTNLLVFALGNVDD